MGRIKIITAPESYEGLSGKFIFLAGTIDNGDSEDWQKEVCDWLKDQVVEDDYVICNPRRAKWNPNAGHDEFIKQIEWELGALKKSSLIILNILGTSKSPISLLEMGLFKDNPGLRVFCPPEFYRFDNVSVTCREFGISLTTDYSVSDIKKVISEFMTKKGPIFRMK